MSDYLPELPIGTVVVEVRTYVKREPDTWIRQHSGEEIRSGWIQGLFADGIATPVIRDRFVEFTDAQAQIRELTRQRDDARDLAVRSGIFETDTP